MLEIDGSLGEGGGQVLRSALSLAMVTGTTVHLFNIRASRPRPGLMRQHLTAVRAAAEICGAVVRGAEVGSRSLWFKPGPVRGGDYRFAIGTAGSASLVVQTVLPALLEADGPSTVTVEGGTHNPLAPPFEFLSLVFLPVLHRMGVRATLELERHGFAPAGGGRLRLRVEPWRERTPLRLTGRGALLGLGARAVVAGGLSRDIAKRELAAVRRNLPIAECDSEIVTLDRSACDGPGNVLMVTARFEQVTEVMTGFGQKGVPAEKVAEQVCHEVRRYLDVPEAAAGGHLADQLLLPLALGRGGTFTTVAPTLHTRTNAEVVRRFLPRPIRMEETGPGLWTVRVGE